MRKIVFAVSCAAGFAVAGAVSAGAMPADAMSPQQAAATATTVQPVQFAERHTRRGVVKCYREFVVGPYRCHHFRNPL